MVRTRLVGFDEERKAIRFVKPLHWELSDVCTYRDETDVIVLDAADHDQSQRISELARGSGSWLFTELVRRRT